MNEIRGTVIRFGDKGYGFIRDVQDIEYFVHQKDIVGMHRLQADQEVMFEPDEGNRGNIARNVRLVGDASPSGADEQSYSDDYANQDDTYRRSRRSYPPIENNEDHNKGYHRRAKSHRHTGKSCKSWSSFGWLFFILFVMQAITLYLLLKN